MNAKLSKREKTMLYVLLCFLILTAGLMGFIFPTLTAQSELEEEYNQVQTQYALAAGTSKEAETLIQRSKELDARIHIALEDFFPVMQAEEIDRNATRILLKNGVTPLSFSMTQAKLNEVKTYYSPDEITYGSAYTSDVTFTFYASSSQFWRIMQDIEETPSVQLQSFTFIPAVSGQAEATETSGQEDETAPSSETSLPQTEGNQYTLTVRLLMERAYAAE